MKPLLIVFFLLTGSIAGAQSVEFKNLEIKVKELVDKSLWDELLVTAPELITSEPSHALGYYYTAMAFYKLEDMEKASEYLSMAETMADDEMKTKISALKKEIETGAKSIEIAQSLSKNASDDDKAIEYKKLWELDKSKTEYALNAIEIYIGKEQYLSALELLNDPQIARDPQAKAIADKINKMPKIIAINNYNRAMKEGADKMKSEFYVQAIDKFDEALKIYPSDGAAGREKRKAQEELAWQSAIKKNSETSIREYLSRYPLGKYKSRADDILERSYLKFARDFVKSKDIDNAIKYYKTYQKYYPKGPQINTVNNELNALYISEAKRYENDKSAYGMKKAQEYYGLALELKPGVVSKDHLESLKRKETRLGKPDAGFFGWSADMDNMLGFMAGALNNRKLGMYISFRTSNTIFEETAYWKTDDENSTADAGSGNRKFTGTIKHQSIYGTLGITKKIVRPLWIYAGAGVAYDLELREFEKDGNTKELVENADSKYVVINPEIGLQLKLGFLTVRYGINKPITPLFKEDFMQHFGVGLSF